MGEMLCINGGNCLSGEVDIGGAKNSLVAIMVASIVTKSIVKLENVKPFDDTYTLIKILNKLHVKTLYDNKDCLYIDSRNIKNVKLNIREVMKIRASYYFMGALLSLYKKVEILGPGGCDFGGRPIDLHLYAFECLGVNYTVKDNLYKFIKKSKSNNIITFKKKSVGATVNAILASCRFPGTVIIENCALEPEIDDLISFLNKCGCSINRDGENIIVEGKNKLHGCCHKIMFDRIEAGTFIIMGSLLSSCLKINNIDVSCMGSVVEILKKIGVYIIEGNNFIEVRKKEGYFPIDVVVDAYPKFPTDLQQPLSVLLSVCDGESHIKENIYPSRISHIQSLNSMGADIEVSDNVISVKGNKVFKGNSVECRDLRGGISLVIAGLLADGKTEISNIDYIRRGYSNLIYKLNKIGADVWIKGESNNER